MRKSIVERKTAETEILIDLDIDGKGKSKIDTKINLVNPHLFDIDGTREISGSGVVYLFARFLNAENKDLAYLAIIGSLGDVQEEYINNEQFKINNEILNDAVSSGKIKIDRGLRMFGLQTRSLHKLLEYSTDPYIPGITGSEENSATDFPLPPAPKDVDSEEE